MREILQSWQRIPLSLDPVAVTFGSVSIYWYALFFLLGSGVTYFFWKKYVEQNALLPIIQIKDFSFGIFVAALIGGKIGFLLLYWLPFISTQNTNWLPKLVGASIALPGMSFIGGAIAVSVYVYYYAKKNKKSFFTLTDALVLFIPIGIFFGRLGNFFHVELFGRVTNVPWGMYFPGENMLRHPSTLYEAFLEGFLLFSILFFLKKQNMCKAEGALTANFAIFYGLTRFLSECFREPDRQIGFIGIFTLNQIFAALLLFLGIIILSLQKK